MTANSNAPIIIKRKKVISGDGHHGGAWKVAYADFVTAMMAFFMLMWLLNATTEQQRKGIADYFSPTIPINRISGGGDGMFGGDDIFSQSTMIRSGTGGSPIATDQGAMANSDGGDDTGGHAAQVAAFNDLEEILLGQGGESYVSELALRHIVTRVTDEGLVIEVFDLPEAELFAGATAEPNPITQEIAAMFARIFVAVENPIAIKGHLRAQTVLKLDNPVWELSTARADTIRRLMEDNGFEPLRISRLAGMADRVPAAKDPTAPRNNRIEVVLLRSDQ